MAPNLCRQYYVMEAVATFSECSAASFTKERDDTNRAVKEEVGERLGGINMLKEKALSINDSG